MKIPLLVIALVASTGFCQSPTATPAPAASPAPGDISLGYRSDIKVDLSAGEQPSPAPASIEQEIKVTVEVDKTYVAAAWITKKMPIIVRVTNNSKERVSLRLQGGSANDDAAIYSLDASGKRTIVYPTGPKLGYGPIGVQVIPPGDWWRVDSEMPFAVINPKKMYQASVEVMWDHTIHFIYSEPFAAPALPAK